MKHAGEIALDQLEPLLARVRALPGLTEKKRGVFYRKSRAFLHFHEDPAGLFGDVRAADDRDFDRFDVTQDGDALIASAEARLRA
ncbi:MAG: hypothetical protein WA047_15460 [Phenylobacterium sp.]|uniref:hypothetical protein n=1 Tax=Phenylobacterium sp. TaxID=1871053 RepID=UPI003BB64A21